MQRNTVDRWMHMRNFALDEDGLGDRMNGLFRIAFDEDKEILEAIQLEELKPREDRPVRIAIDKGANMYRRIISEMVAGESARTGVTQEEQVRVPESRQKQGEKHESEKHD